MGTGRRVRHCRARVCVIQFLHCVCRPLRFALCRCTLFAWHNPLFLFLFTPSLRAHFMTASRFAWNGCAWTFAAGPASGNGRALRNRGE